MEAWYRVITVTPLLTAAETASISASVQISSQIYYLRGLITNCRLQSFRFGYPQSRSQQSPRWLRMTPSEYPPVLRFHPPRQTLKKSAKVPDESCLAKSRRMVVFLACSCAYNSSPQSPPARPRLIKTSAAPKISAQCAELMDGNIRGPPSLSCPPQPPLPQFGGGCRRAPICSRWLIPAGGCAPPSRRGTPKSPACPFCSQDRNLKNGFSVTLPRFSQISCLKAQQGSAACQAHLISFV